MATAESTGANRHLDEDRLVRSLVPDPVQVPDVKVLVGFLGRSARAGYWRLYFTAELDHYCDFREEDVVHSVSLETDQNPLGGTAVWVNREANVLYTRTRSREAQADFLRGDIASAHRGRSRVPGLMTRLAGVNPRLYYLVHSIHLSCVPEFCEFVPATWPGDWGEGVAGCTWEAEC